MQEYNVYLYNTPESRDGKEIKIDSKITREMLIDLLHKNWTPTVNYVTNNVENSVILGLEEIYHGKTGILSIGSTYLYDIDGNKAIINCFFFGETAEDAFDSTLGMTRDTFTKMLKIDPKYCTLYKLDENKNPILYNNYIKGE